MKDLLIKGKEVEQLVQYLDVIPHGYGKKIESFFAELYALREKEAAEASKNTKGAASKQEK